jgi:hypothetical protein
LVAFFTGSAGKDQIYSLPKKEADALKSHATALLWAICPLAIFICMQGLVIRVAVAGINFK